VVGNFEGHYVPIDEHRRYFETSPFVQGVDLGNILEKPSALTGGYGTLKRYMGSRSYSQNYINIRLQPQRYTSQPLLTK